MIKLMDLLTEGARDPGIFKGIFLAGGPGSGKSYVASQLFGIPDNVNVSKTGLKMVNQDAELELLLKKYFGTTDIDNMPDELFADLTGVDKAGVPVDYDTSGMRKFAKSLSQERLRIYKNMAFFQGLFGNANFLLVDNSKHLSVKEAEKKFKMLVEKGIDKFLKKPIKSKIGKAWLRREKKHQKVFKDPGQSKLFQR